MTDRDLLIAYQQTKSPAHFAQLVKTHINLVYSVARRHAKDPHLAEDITQEVFLTLARKAPALKPDIPLAGWLFTTTRLYSLQSLRAKSRRNRHETEAAMSHDPPPPLDPTWSLIAEDIDKAVADLPPTDRDALLLRYFTGKSNTEIAAILAISEEAAKKRVQRALDSLQKLLTSRGLAPTSAASAITALTLAAALTTHAVQAAPPALASSINTALAAKTTAAVATKGTLMAAAKLKTALIATVIAITASAGTAVYFSKRAASPSAPPPRDNTPPAIADAAPAPEDFQRAYGLPPGQVLAVVPDAPANIRTALYQQSLRGKSTLVSPPTSMAVSWHNEQPILWSGSSDKSFPLLFLLPDIIDIYTPEIISDLPLTSLPGDIVFQEKATPDEYLQSLQSLLSNGLKRQVTCTFRTQPEDTIVLRGNFQFTPIPDRPPTHAATPTIEFYAENADAPDMNGGLRSPSSANMRSFAGQLSERINYPVIIESPNFPKLLFYRLSFDTLSSLSSPDDVNHFLQHITEQTGLTATHETRPIRCLAITYSDAHLPADGWKGWTVGAYPAVSPFQAIRWNNDTPEVQINDTWYQLLKFNDLPAEQIITAAKSADHRDWQLRFEEDLPALLAYMGHEPAATATLEVKNLQTQKTETLTDVPLTTENRKAIHNASTKTASPALHAFQNAPKISPFSAIRWNNNAPEVQINADATWYELISFNNIPTANIIAFAKKTDKNWQGRFEEDFVPLLTLMGHEPAATATLEVKNLQTQKTETLADIELTKENRDAIYHTRHPQPDPCTPPNPQ